MRPAPQCSSLLAHRAALTVALLLLAGLALTALRPMPARAATIEVSTTNDGGPGSLRAAITAANGSAEPDTITFAPNVTGTITLATSLPEITGELTIQGPGAGSLAISGGNAVRILTVSAGAQLSVTGLTLADGQSGFGGAIENGGNLTITTSTFRGNLAVLGGAGGAIDNRGSLTITTSTFRGNEAEGAGGAIDSRGSLTITTSTFSDNQTNLGGAIGNHGSLTITTSTFSDNQANEGGAIFNSGSLSITNSTLSGNSGGSDGGAILNEVGSVTIENSTLSDNQASGGGGAIRTTAAGSIDITASTLRGNSADVGGAISNAFASINITNSTLSNNRADGLGGAIYNEGGVTIENSTLSGNTATGSAGGAAIYNQGTSSRVEITNSTIAANQGTTRALSLADGSGSLRNVLLANATNLNCGGTPTDLGGNIASDDSCAFTSPESHNDTDPLLDSLADNGGPTETIALQPGSPAIDAAVDCPPPATDQRGVARPHGAACDSGAYETEAAPTAEIALSATLDTQPDGTVPPGPTVRVGDTLTLTVTVTNSGEVTVSDVTIESPTPGLTWVTGPALGTLEPGESATGTATYVVTQADVDLGEQQIPLTVTAQAPSSQEVSAETTLYYTGGQPAPTITSIDPSQGPEDGGTDVTITGSGFVANTTVSFGGTPADDVTVVSATELLVTTAAHVPGPVDVTATNPDGQNATLEDAFRYIAPPVAMNDAATTPPGLPVDIDVLANDTGDGIAVTAVTQPADGAAMIDINPDGTITYTPIADFAGTNSFTYTITDVVGQTATATVTVTVTAAPVTTITLGVPTVNGMPADSRPGPTVTPGNTITVAVTVTNSGTVDASVSGTSDVGTMSCSRGVFSPGQSITCSVTTTPEAGAQQVAITITAQGTNGQSVEASTTAFYTGVQPTPTISSVTPPNGPIEGGTRVTITGSGFRSGAGVRFDGLPATNAIVVSATTIEATTPPHAAGPVSVSVLNSDGQGASLPAGFTYVDLTPIVTSVSPNQGPEAGGTPVTIIGSGFRPGETTVTFGGVPAGGVSCASTTHCQAVSPPGQGTVSVQVTVAGRTSAATPAAAFTYEPPPRPMTLAVQVWRQIPPIVSENQTEPTIVPVVGGVVEARIDGVLCGQGVTDSQGRVTLEVAADPPAAGCGRDGRALSFRVNGAVAAGDPLRFQSGGQAAATLILPGPMPPPRR